MIATRPLISAALLLGLAAVGAAPTAAGQPYERWDTKLRNAHGFVLMEEDVAVGGKPAFVNGEWQGAFSFQLSNCPGAGCQTYAGTIQNSTNSLDDYVGTYAFAGGACVLEARIGEDKQGMDSGFVLKLAPKSGAADGCKPFPAKIAGQYTPYWINHAKMAAQSKAP